MKSGKILFLFLIIPLITGCGSSGSSSSSGGSGTTISAGVNNVIPITVNGSLCSSNSYPNKPCVSVVVCTPGTSSCQTINDILLDTGSYGLRIFKQVLTVPLAPITGSTGSLGECVQYGDGSSDWGSIQVAGVILGNEPAVQVPIQVIDSTFGTVPAACANTDQSPATAGFNGILGAGLFAQDCGSICSSTSDNGLYYICSGSNCSGAAASLSDQVRNPVSLLPQDNNGIIVKLPSVQAGGASSVNGSLVLGIGTQSNNVPSGVTVYPADQYGEIFTTFNNVVLGSFLDTGTNGLFFPSPSESMLPNCPSPAEGFFCPSSIQSLSATNTGAFGSPNGLVPFQIGNFDSLYLDSLNNVFDDIGGNQPNEFGWGLPFFLGRNVFVGIDGTGSSLGSGPYWAY
jgi:hypothetical protein